MPTSAVVLWDALGDEITLTSSPQTESQDGRSSKGPTLQGFPTTGLNNLKWKDKAGTPTSPFFSCH